MYNISPPTIFFSTVDSLVRLRHPGSDGGHRSSMVCWKTPPFIDDLDDFPSEVNLFFFWISQLATFDYRRVYNVLDAL